MKIGIDGRAANWYRGTGIGTYTYQLINHINNIDSVNNYMVFLPEHCSNNINFKPNFTIAQITENCKKNFWDEVNIPNILKGNDMDLYHVPQNGIGLPLDKKCSFVMTLHDVIPYKMPETSSERYLKLFNETLPEIVSMCDGIITVSNHSKLDILEAFNFPKEKIYVTHLASENIYHPMEKKLSKELIKKHYSIDDEYILYVGGFSPRKNIVGLIDAFSKLLNIYKRDLKLIIAGKQGQSYSIYKKRCEDLGIENKVIFPGFIPLEHMPSLYNGCELFVYPSFYEGFGLPPVEAMACGTPVIASNSTSIPEVTGDAALLVHPKNVDQLCSSMYDVLTNNELKEDLSLKGLIRASELNWGNTAKNTLIAYNKILNS
ncbi:glycosyltransferase family 1 protein [uncultured Clostridium sp.]|uniref:glycosyltransferase family 4 protein n=1 Tax=uncultured Clostridium sp. TaxID=59620 RepID=UPI0028EEBEF8|nr:glycosyltransferase family 1 protein [uncultured Clostridium sp.]